MSGAKTIERTWEAVLDRIEPATIGPSIALLTMLVAFSILSPHFLTVSNLTNVLVQSAPLLILAAGQTFALLMGAWAIVTGALLLGASYRLNIPHGRWLMALAGAISVIWGVLLIIWPLIGALVLTWWMAAYALIFGVAMLVLALRLRGRRPAVAPPGAVPRGI